MITLPEWVWWKNGLNIAKFILTKRVLVQEIQLGLP